MNPGDGLISVTFPKGTYYFPHEKARQKLCPKFESSRSLNLNGQILADALIHHCWDDGEVLSAENMASFLLLSRSENLPILASHISPQASNLSLQCWLDALRLIPVEYITQMDREHPLYQVTETVCRRAPDTASGKVDALDPETPLWLRTVLVEIIFHRAEKTLPKPKESWKWLSWMPGNGNQ